MKCTNCGYSININSDITAAKAHCTFGVQWELWGHSILGMAMNRKTGSLEGVTCPKCGAVGRWQDI